MYSKDHTWGTKINYYSIIPDCCENPSISSERYPDSSYNQPCSMDADELAMFEHYGSPKVCMLLRMFVRVLGLMCACVNVTECACRGCLSVWSVDSIHTSRAGRCATRTTCRKRRLSLTP